MELWILWYQTVAALRPACARTRTFLWLLVVLAAMTVRTDLAGVTSLVRSHWLRGPSKPPPQNGHLRKLLFSNVLRE